MKLEKLPSWSIILGGYQERLKELAERLTVASCEDERTSLGYDSFSHSPHR